MLRIIVSGGPCSGKTTLINEIQSRGFFTLPEAALYLISHTSTDNDNIYPWTNPEKFQEKLYKLQNEWEKAVPQNINFIFQDRSLVDCLAYYNYYNLKSPKELRIIIKRANYSLVFFLETLPEDYWTKTTNNIPRSLKYQNGLELQNILYKTYLKSRVKMIRVKFMPVNNRLKFMFQSLEHEYGIKL